MFDRTKLHEFAIVPLNGMVFDNKLRRRVTSTESFGGEITSQNAQVVIFDLIEKARILAAHPTKADGTRSLGEDYFSVTVQYAPGKTRRITAFSTQIPALVEAVEAATAEDSEVDYINFAGEKITQNLMKGRNVPNEVRDTRGNLLAGIELVMKDKTSRTLLSLPGEAVNSGRSTM